MNKQPAMSKQPTTNRFFRTVAPICLAALSGLAGCGEGELDPTDSLARALTGHSAGPYGSTTGTADSSGGSHLSPVTKIIGYYSQAYVYGVKLFWADGTSKMYGVTTDDWRGISHFNLVDDPVTQVDYVVASGRLIGLKFTNSSGNLLLGYPTTQTAFSDPNAVFTDLDTWTGNVTPTKTVMWGAKIHYTTP